MEILKYESFLETMQFATLTNAQKLAKQEEERRKAKKEADNKDTTPVKQTPVQHDDTEGDAQMELPEDEESQMNLEDEESQMEEPEDGEEI
jgi:hypothetical protein